MIRFKCFDPVSATLMLVAAGGSIYSGMQQQSAAKKQEGMQEEQARLALQESKSNAEVEAYNQTQALNKQKLAFIKSGVSLEGSPLDVLENTRQWGQKSVDAISRQGTAQYSLGMRQAAQTKASGRAALIGGFTQAAGTAATYGVKAQGLNSTKTVKTSMSPNQVESYVSN